METSQLLTQYLAELYALRRSDATPGLERAQTLASALGNPHIQFPSIHIAGTNGKGTVSSVVASVLKEAGYKVGLYTSPHIVRFNERIRVNGVAISDDALLERIQEIMPLVRSHNAIFFEAATIMAFQHFANENVDIAIIETGLGGRLDATNILPAKNVLLTAITSIDFDHTEFLGDTLSDIAGEKAGIMKQNVPCIIGEARPELWLTFMEHSAHAQAPVCFLDDAYRVNINRFNPNFSMNLALKAPKLALEDIHVNLCGRHQARNVLTAFALVQQVQKRFPVSIDALRQGLANIKENSGLRGRIEVLRPKNGETEPIVLDVAHNPAGVEMLVETLQACGYADSRWHVVFTAMQDKRIETMLETLAPITTRLYAPHLDFPRARTNTNVADAARALGIAAEAFDSVHAAYHAALTNADAEQAPVLLAGSFHLAEEILAQEQL